MNAPPTSLQNFQDGTREGRAQVQPNKSPQVEDSQLTVWKARGAGVNGAEGWRGLQILWSVTSAEGSLEPAAEDKSALVYEERTQGYEKNHPEGVEEMIWGAHTGPGIDLVLTSQNRKLSRWDYVFSEDAG